MNAKNTTGAQDGQLTASPQTVDYSDNEVWSALAARRARTLSVLRAVRVCRQSRAYRDGGRFADFAVNMLAR